MTREEINKNIGVCVNKPFEIRMYSDRGFDTIICERHVSTAHYNGITQYGNQEWTYTSNVYTTKGWRTVKKIFKHKSEIISHISKNYSRLFSIAISKL